MAPRAREALYRAREALYRAQESYGAKPRFRICRFARAQG
jgi:hypothetical protein